MSCVGTSSKKVEESSYPSKLTKKINGVLKIDLTQCLARLFIIFHFNKKLLILSFDSDIQYVIGFSDTVYYQHFIQLCIKYFSHFNFFTII